jgi:hypothetical protein
MNLSDIRKMKALPFNEIFYYFAYAMSKTKNNDI